MIREDVTAHLPSERNPKLAAGVTEVGLLPLQADK
jgi:hypothetical protein